MSSPPSALELSADGALLAVGDLSQTVTLFDVESGQSRWSSLVFQEQDYSDVVFDDGYVMSPPAEAFWTNTEFLRLFFQRGVLDLLWERDSLLAAGSGQVVRLDESSGSELARVAPTGVHPALGEVPAPPAKLESKGGRIASSWATGYVLLDQDLSKTGDFRLQTGRRGIQTHAIDTSLDEDGNVLALLNNGKLMWTMRDPSVARPLVTVPVAAPSAMALSPDGGIAAVSGGNGVTLSSVDGRQLLAKAVPRRDRDLLTISPDGSKLTLSNVTGTGSEPAIFVDLETGAETEIGMGDPELLALNVWFLTDDLLLGQADFADNFRWQGTYLWDADDLDRPLPTVVPSTNSGEELSPNGDLFVVSRGPGFAESGGEIEVFDLNSERSLAAPLFSLSTGANLQPMRCSSRHSALTAAGF